MKKTISFIALVILVTGSMSPALSVSIGNSVEYIPDSRKLGIGVIDPGAELEVNGQIMITGGNPQNGYVLTTDATGLATWEEPDIPGPAGPNTAVQFNNAGTTAGSSDLSFNDASNELNINGTVKANALEGDGSGITGIPSAACNNQNTGLMKFDTNLNKPVYCNGSSWVPQPSGDKPVIGTGEWTGQCTQLVPPSGTSVATHNIYYYWAHRSQENWEKSHALRGSGLMPSDAGVQACGSPYTPQAGSYIIIAVPK